MMMNSKKLPLRSVVFIAHLVCFSGFQANELSRFHYGQVLQDHVLAGNKIVVEYTRDMLACGHLCLAYPQCGSYNYENSASKHGLCEIKEAGQTNELTFKQGSVFVELLNSWPVCLYKIELYLKLCSRYL